LTLDVAKHLPYAHLAAVPKRGEEGGERKKKEAVLGAMREWSDSK